MLFLATARVIHAIQDAPEPAKALDVTVIGHQFWWEFRYPKLGIVTANELHVPVSDPAHPTPTFLKLLSADTDHSFWVPQLAGKTDLIPDHPNRMWMDPHRTGSYLGQCAQYCGTQHAKMLLRVSVDTPADFDAWVRAAAETGDRGRKQSRGQARLRKQRLHQLPRGERHGGRRALRAGSDPLDEPRHARVRRRQNTPENLRLWIQNPDAIKPGSLMPAMKLSDADLNAVVELSGDAAVKEREITYVIRMRSPISRRTD